MKKKSFFTSYLFLIFLLIGNMQIVAQEPTTILGLSQMVSLAISNNLELQKVNYQLQNTTLEVQRMEAENLLTESTIADLQKEITLLNQQSQFQAEKDQLFIQVVDYYFQLLMAEKDIDSKKENVELEETVLKDVEKKVATGYSIDLDLLQQGNEYYDALFSYQESVLDYQQLIIETKNALGIPRDQTIKLTKLSIPRFSEVDLTEAITLARENSFTLQSQEIRMDQILKELEKSKVNGYSEIEIQELENERSIAGLEKSLTLQNLDYQVETQWLNYNQAKNDIALSQKNLEQMKENELMIRRQVQAGLRTEEEALSSVIGVLDAESRLISSVRQVYQAFLELQRLMGTLDEGVLP
ncbi:MAG: TolC family protein [Candidatus Atribacteria bacterium]|nr:TolC family protein [Candidatus Atribacteria bacterium]